MRLGAVRIGTPEADLARLGLPHQPSGPGRPARYGPYHVLFAAGIVEQVGVHLRDTSGVRFGEHLFRAGVSRAELLGALPHCVDRAHGGTECAGNGVRFTETQGASARAQPTVELWVRVRPEPLLVVPGAQLGAVRIGMTEAELRATGRPVRDMLPGSFWVDGVAAYFEAGRVVRAHATLSYFGRVRVGERVIDEGDPERERAFARCVASNQQAVEMHTRACAQDGVRFTRGLGTDEEVEVRAPSP